jgi:hypothetical protein
MFLSSISLGLVGPNANVAGDLSPISSRAALMGQVLRSHASLYPVGDSPLCGERKVELFQNDGAASPLAFTLTTTPKLCGVNWECRKRVDRNARKKVKYTELVTLRNSTRQARNTALAIDWKARIKFDMR